MMELATDAQKWGAFAFGAVMGWNLYLINRYRAGDVKLEDLVTLIGAIGGSAILALFDAKTDLFGFYGLGLASGFFAYFLVLVLLVAKSPKFDFNWFLDGRRKKLDPGEEIPAGMAPTIRAMEDRGKEPIE